MVTVIFDRKENGNLMLEVSGHAAAAPGEENLVCAAVTALCYTLAQALRLQRSQLREEADICIRDGWARIRVRPGGDSAGEVMHTFRVIYTGLQLLAYNYPDQIKIVREGKKTV